MVAACDHGCLDSLQTDVALRVDGYTVDVAVLLVEGTTQVLVH